MIKNIRLLCIILCVFMAFSLVSCKKDKVENQNQPEKLESADWDKLPEYAQGYPSAQEVVTAYKQANDPFCWFVQTKLPPLDKEDEYMYNGIPYYRVLSDQIVNLETLEKYLTLFYNDEIVELLIDVNSEIEKFVEDENGNLYCNAFAYVPEGIGEKEDYKVEKNSETSYTLTVSFDRLKEDGSIRGKGTERYVYEKIDGRWLFTRYRIFRQ